MDQVEHLKAVLARQLEKHGPDDFSVKQLRQQIAGMERQREMKWSETPVVMRAHFESYGNQEDD